MLTISSLSRRLASVPAVCHYGLLPEVRSWLTLDENQDTGNFLSGDLRSNADLGQRV